jgi:cellulose synthase/poly-beta-1,6-N-acetylglucosamine synthase-like glycosyltransferase
MMALWGLLAIFASLCVFALSAFLLAEVLADFADDTDDPPAPVGADPRIAVVIPAHDEESGVGATIANALAEMGPGDRILVVADNCGDGTATAARAAGADVAERRDPDRRGKGYALQYGVDHLRAAPPDVVVFTDADCRFERGALKRIARRAASEQRPVQALYLMNPPEGAGPKDRVSAFAWFMMNRIRMNGLYRLSGATRLTGAGMAFPWALIESEPLASGEVVEDLALSIRMVERGAPPMLDRGAVVVSALAKSAAGAATQRARWENGSIAMARRHVLALFARGLRGDGKALAFACDVAVPPLILFAMLQIAAVLFAAPPALFGHDLAFDLAFWSLIFFGASIVIAWARGGKYLLPASEFGGVVAYFLEKLRIYGGEGRRSASVWTRTDRGDEP